MTANPLEKQKYTVADLESMPDDGTRRELINGELIEMPGAKPAHNLIATLLAHYLAIFVLPKKSGIVMTEMSCHLTRDPDIFLIPDVGYVSAVRLGKHNLDEYIPFAPDLAIEVISPSNSADEIDTKIALYRRYGSHLVWIVYPNSKNVHVYRADGAHQIVDKTGVLDGADVLPGLTISIAAMFAEVEGT